MTYPKLLIIDDELNFYGVFRQMFSAYFAFEVTSDAKNGLTKIAGGGWDLVVLDLNFPGQYSYKDGLEILLKQALLKASGRFPILVATSDNDIDTERIAVDMGASGLLRKAEYDPLVWGNRIKEAIEQFSKKKVVPTTTRKKTQPRDFFLTASPLMEAIKLRLQKLVNYPDAAVLITGETGVGKEIATKYLHDAKGNADIPFKAVNLAAIQPELIDSEIFGHVKGAFTTAIQNKSGYFEEVKDGTLFLDEIGEVSFETQVKLLRVLEERKFQKLGSTTEIPLKAQIVFATHRNLDAMVKAGTFRQDFYERIKTISIHIPPLRERKGEIRPLINRFFEDHCKEEHPFFGKTVEQCFSEAVLDCLYNFSWPSNIRELRNTAHQLLFEADVQGKKIIDTELLPMRFRSPVKQEEIHENPASPLLDSGAGAPQHEQINWPIDKQTAYNELLQIEQTLIQAGGRKDEAAKELGMKNDQALRYRVKSKYFEKYPDFIKNFPILSKVYKFD